MLKLKIKKKKEKTHTYIYVGIWVAGSLVGSLSPKDKIVGSVNAMRQMGNIGTKVVHFDFNLPSH
jgi:hypothetical protein